MKPAYFDYHRAESLEQATDLLAELGDDALALAGGYSLVPMMNLRLARPRHLVDINALGLDRIERDGGVVRIGCLVRHSQYSTDPTIGEFLPLFAEVSRHIAHPVIRARGTLGGSLAHADPTAELALMAVLYDAAIHVRSSRGARKIQASEFFKGAFMTALEPGEIIVELAVPVPASGGATAFYEFSERQGDFAIIAIAANIRAENGRIAEAGIACAGALSTPVRNAEVEQFLVGRSLDAPGGLEAGRMFAAAHEPMGDIRATPDYRRHLIAELTRRAVESASADAGRAA